MISTYHPRRHIVVSLVLAMLFLVVPVGHAQEATPGLLPGQDPSAPCSNGRLQIGDLSIVQATLDEGVVEAKEEASSWQSDARLYTLRLGCPLLTSGYQWEGVFFSEDAQAFYATDTGEVEAVDDDPSTIPSLDPGKISLQQVHRSLLRTGFSDELLLSAQGGVTIRTSTETHPFGPDAAPRDQVYAHVAIEVSGQVTDVWVSVTDGTVYQYGR